MTWAPPPDPDPFEILQSAGADSRGGAHARALAKFMWFHHNALQHNPDLSAVRLSSGVSDWAELAALYPPARAALLRTRDEVEAAFRADPAAFDRFHELAALNRCLGDGARTAELFVRAATGDRAAAEGLYRVAEPFLIATGRYEACGPFLDPPWRLSVAADLYALMVELEAAGHGVEPSPPPLARGFYMHDVVTLVGLLALNRRPQEAEQACGEALAVLDDAEFRALLAAAMSGHLPPPQFG